MLGYLIYDKKDIERNINFIQWLIEGAEKYDIELLLFDQHTDFTTLETPDFIMNRSRFTEPNLHFNCYEFNGKNVISIANDKWLTYEYFHKHVPMMPTYKINDITHYPCIVKKRNGHGGDDVHLIHAPTTFSEDYIAQDLAPVLGKDLRVYIMNNEIYASVIRENPNHFKSNFSLGGSAKLYNLSSKETQLIHKILNLLPMMYGGIDFLFDENNDLILNEIEDPVGARMLYNLTDLNVVDDLFKNIKKYLEKDS